MRYVSNKYVANELIRQQQRPAQSQFGMLKAFIINFTGLKQCLPSDFAENLLARKKNQIKLGTGYRNIEL